MTMTADWATDLDDEDGPPKPPRRKVERPVDILAYVLAGNATFTLEGRVSRFTYRVRASDTGLMFFVGLLTGSDNNSDYSYLGTLRAGRDETLAMTKKSRAGEDAPSVRAFRWFWRALVEKNEEALDKVQFWHEGRCGRCGRLLTVPESLDRGIGPECWEKMGGGA